MVLLILLFDLLTQAQDLTAWWDANARGYEDRRLRQLEDVGSTLACIVPFAASGGQRVMELQVSYDLVLLAISAYTLVQVITLLETEQNEVRCLHFQPGIGCYLLGDYAKQEGAD